MTINSPSNETEKTEDHIPEPPMTDVHQCMAAASSSTRSTDKAMVNFSVRLPADVKAQAMFVCERNATDLGTYLRECTKALLRDYGFKLPDQE